MNNKDARSLPPEGLAGLDLNDNSKQNKTKQTNKLVWFNPENSDSVKCEVTLSIGQKVKKWNIFLKVGLKSGV